jgi:hypothetical protein
MFGEGGIKKPLPEPPITIRFHERTGKEPVLVHTGKFENRSYMSEWGYLISDNRDYIFISPKKIENHGFISE